MFRRIKETDARYEELEELYNVPEVRLVLEARLQETEKLFSREIAKYFTTGSDD